MRIISNIERLTKKMVHLKCQVTSRDNVVLIWDVIGGAQPAFGLVELRETSDLRSCIIRVKDVGRRG